MEKKGEKLRARRSKSLLPSRRSAGVYVDLLAGKKSVRAAIAVDLQHSPRYNLVLHPGPRSAALYNKRGGGGKETSKDLINSLRKNCLTVERGRRLCLM